jgi:mono/diheme cytochrome c family protein
VTGALKRRGSLAVAGVALAVALIAAVLIVVLATRGSSPSGSTAVAAGQQIYRTGIDPNGTPIAYSGGTMMRASCATCHGTDGHGRTTPMVTAPNITYANLTSPQGMLAPDGSRGPTYTDATIHKAVTQGIDPTGASLAAAMPRWQLSDQAWTDLLAYLKTLG